MPPTDTTTPPAATEAPAEAVTPLMRGIAVLRRLTDADGTLSLSELERATGLARSTVDRVTATLARMGFVRLDGRDAVLTPRVMALGNAYLAALRLPGLLGGHADALADALDESVSLAVPDRDGIRFLHQATRRRAMSLSFRIGDLLPAERTAPGALFAAEWTDAEWARWRERRAADPEDRGFLAVPPRDTGGAAADDRSDDGRFEERAREARERGWALDDQLIEPGLVALSVPVHAPDGSIACAVNVVSHTSRHSAASLRDTLLSRLRETVDGMERELAQAADEPAPEPAEQPLAAWTAASKQELGREFIESLARGLTVLTAFGEGRAELTLSAAAEATGLARATARRALITLEHLGYVASEGRTFRLIPRVLALGYPPLSRTSLPQIAAPHLAALAARVHDSASLAALDGDDIRYTARVATTRVMSVNITVGTRLPAYATALGRAMLAGLPPAERYARLTRSEPRPLTPRTVTGPDALATLLDQVADQGYALVEEELEEGLRSIAVPVRSGTGEVVAAVNVAMHTVRRTTEECVTDVLPELRATVAGIEADLHIAGRFARIPLT
ncbi:IclR family transcriptional regulator domain-containing protein [Streptomyces purpurogeneiscleroticus]|uniref:IclR family transcriptional regulator domain-containing protein n=1 Tax=Streptomyces purpurogeneiscleroticus TaxID=68259 RepID=UPI001CBBD6D0|nr:IclR family transcriptional regulator C-terminal domain-containing protein [Streptomyces purpurogeneiscleroticus]MBZ4019270.1 IclR family transcriptional regulator [Streptomyces purpurogeneiscleroticus]